MPFYAIETWDEAARLLAEFPAPPKGPFLVPTALGIAVADALRDSKRAPISKALRMWWEGKKTDPLYDRVRLR